MTEKQNKQQYESFVTSCIHTGSFDMIISYKEWLESVRAYKPQLPSTNAEYAVYWQKLEDMQNLTRLSIPVLKEMFKR